MGRSLKKGPYCEEKLLAKMPFVVLYDRFVDTFFDLLCKGRWQKSIRNSSCDRKRSTESDRGQEAKGRVD